MNVSDFKSGDHLEEVQLLLDEIRVCVSNTGKQYYNLVFQDNTGKIDAKKWEVVPGDENIYVPGNILRVRGDVNLYNNALQLKVISAMPVSANEVDLTRFVLSAPEDKKRLEAELRSFVYSIKDNDLHTLVAALLNDYKKDYLNYPAATKNHHAYGSGLLYHSVCMTRLADQICKLYPTLNRDLLISGTILHDLGKVKELSGVVATQYTVEGKLIGHLVIASELIEEKAKELNIDSEQVILLKHMMLSHHGKLEFGAAKLPLTKEAFALAMIDDFDAKMEILRLAYENVEPGEWTAKINALDNRSFYNSFFTSNVDKE